jgi:hypothetical protein
VQTNEDIKSQNKSLMKRIGEMENYIEVIEKRN